MPAPLFLSDEDYKLACSLMPIVCIDLLVRDAADQVLLGFRANEPAAGSWFLPGGRIRKGEKLDDAFGRLARQELGLEATGIADARLRGVYEHFYDTDFTGDPLAPTHYVTLAYELPARLELQLPEGEQHQRWAWMSVDALLENAHVHRWTKAYFDAASHGHLIRDAR